MTLELGDLGVSVRTWNVLTKHVATIEDLVKCSHKDVQAWLLDHKGYVEIIDALAEHDLYLAGSEGGSLIQIHDHFDGTAHCVECGGECKLEGAERELTLMVRYLMEERAFCKQRPIPSGMLGRQLEGLLGDSVKRFTERAIASTELPF